MWPWGGNRTGKDAEALQYPLVGISQLMFSWWFGCVLAVTDQTALLPGYLSLYAYKGRNFTPFQPSVS